MERKVERKFYFCVTCSSPWLVHDISEYSHSIVIAHVLKVNVVHLRKKIYISITDRLLVGKFKISHNYSSESLTCNSMSPGSMRPSAATAPPFIIEPM